jgi:uncharacterized protein (TIGR02246 family)
MIKKLLLAASLFANFSFVFAVTPTAAYTPEQQNVLNASENWQQAIDARNPKAIVALYDNNAYFYPTFVNEITTPQNLYNYFVKLTAKPQLQVIFDQEHPRVYANDTVAVNSGLYTFSYLGPHHHTIEVPARFTFVYLKENDQWLIIEHHSSVLPEKQKKK